MRQFKFYNFETNDCKNFSLCVFGISVLSFYYSNRFGWVRIFGKGVKWKDVSVHRLLFSERYGYGKYISIGNWRIAFLY